jgi:hypothetical protein
MIELWAENRVTSFSFARAGIIGFLCDGVEDSTGPAIIGLLHGYMQVAWLSARASDLGIRVSSALMRVVASESAAWLVVQTNSKTWGA